MTKQRTFTLLDTEEAKFQKWRSEVLKRGVDHQKKTIENPDIVFRTCWEDGFPYTGAIGGQFTFSFIPTSVGTIVKVSDFVTGEVCDITDYDSF